MENIKIVKLGDTVLMHYKISADNGTEFENSFGAEPLQLTIGNGDIPANLEQWLVGIETGERYVFQLEPQQAFGESDSSLIQQIPLDMFPDDMPAEIGSLIEFGMPNGTVMAGEVKSKNQAVATVDFNHPLSDCPILFEVEVLKVL